MVALVGAMSNESISIERFIVAAVACLVLVIASFEKWSGAEPSAEIASEGGDRIATRLGSGQV